MRRESQVVVSKRAARRFLVRRSGLARPPEERPGWAGKNGVVEAVRALEYVQVDPMQVVATNQDLVLGARVQDYAPGLLDAALYRDRALVEVPARNRCIVPAEDYPVFQVVFAWSERRNRPGLGELEPVMAGVLARIEAEGPLCSLDFDDNRRVSGWWEPDGQARTRAVRQALEWLWYFGRVAISHRAGTRRYFDLPERLFGPGAALPPYEPPGWSGGRRAAGGAGALGPLLRKYLRAVGLADPRNWAFGWWKYTAPEKKRIVDDLVSAGELVAVIVDSTGGTTYYVPSCEAGELLGGAEQDLESALYVLPPLDNLVWMRGRLADLFGFEYTWEAYVPEEKRRYGPYTCPILLGDSFVGRVDAATDRKEGAVVVRGLWWETGAPPVAEKDLRAALGRVAAAAGAGRIRDPEGLMKE